MDESEEYLDSLPQFKQLVPKAWSHLLTDKFDSISATEWVGYKRSTSIVFAQVAYPILSEEDSSSDEVSAQKYKIYLREDDYEGKEVTTSQLSKFECTTQYEKSKMHQQWGSMQYENFEMPMAALSSTEISKDIHIVSKMKSKPDSSEGWRYIEQAKVDFDNAEIIAEEAKAKEAKAKEERPKLNSLVCFLSHEVAEKAIEGLLRAFCGKLDTSWHKLEKRIKVLKLNSRVKETVAQDMLKHVKMLKGYYYSTRYPDKCPDKKKIPADYFTQDMVEKSLKHAEHVLGTCIDGMPTKP